MISINSIAHIIAMGKNNLPVLKGFLQLSALRAMQIFLGLATTYVLVRSLSIGQYGEYQFVLNVLGVMALFTLTEFGNTLTQSVARGYTGSFRTLMRRPIIGSLGASVVLLAFAIWYGRYSGHESLMMCFIIAAILFPFAQGLTLWKSFKIGEEKFFDFTKLESLNMILTQGGIMLMAIFFKGQYIGPFLLFMIIPSLINIMMFWRTLKHIPKDAPAEDGVIRHGMHSSVFTAAYVASNYVDKLLLFFFLSPAALALFVAAERISDLVKTGVQDMASALAPKFAKTAHYTQKLDRFLKILCAAFGIALIIFAFTALPYVITLIYGDQYAAAIPYSQALFFSAAIGNLASIQFRFIRSKLDTDNFRNIILLTSISRMVISLVLIPFFGLTGAVASAILYRLIMSFTINHVIQKEYLLKPAPAA